MSDNDNMFTVKGLNGGYGRSQVLFDVNMTVPRKGAIAILGRNGAGKTTLLKTLAGELTPMSGEIVLDGIETTTTSPECRVHRGLGYVPQDQAIFSKLSVQDNLNLGAIRQTDKSGIDQVLQTFPKLAERLSQPAGTLSGGERKMLAIGRALLGKPSVLMLDEPTEGVWVGVIEEIAEQLLVLAKEISVIIVEQHIELALRVANYAYVMDRGHMALEGHADAIKADPRLLRYLAP